MTHWQYGILFLILSAAAFVGAAITRLTGVCATTVWLAVSCFWTAAAFFFHCPEMVLGKRQNRICFLPFAIVNFPFLFAYWLVWMFRHLILRHEPVHEIPGTGISVSCWPAFHVSLENYDFVVDVSSETPKLYRTQTTPTTNESQNQSSLPKYICLPNLDGVPLDRLELSEEIRRGMRILVHCAQGRGRSAVMACLLLVKLEYARTGEEAFQTLKSSRPKVHVSRYQMEQIRKFKEK
ncbi:MAG: hypothetical protein LBT05_13185 [Planctomycetaceae bacterium]|jgi:protein-tyrosine phosphatase|nr:hypothetical protein [Planctomycetaceae bacterium]